MVRRIKESKNQRIKARSRSVGPTNLLGLVAREVLGRHAVEAAPRRVSVEVERSISRIVAPARELVGRLTDLHVPDQIRVGRSVSRRIAVRPTLGQCVSLLPFDCLVWRIVRQRALLNGGLHCEGGRASGRRRVSMSACEHESASAYRVYLPISPSLDINCMGRLSNANVPALLASVTSAAMATVAVVFILRSVCVGVWMCVERYVCVCVCVCTCVCGRGCV